MKTSLDRTDKNMTLPSPNEWFAVDHQRIPSLNGTNPWPWKNLSYHEWCHVYESSLSITDNMRLARFFVTNCFFALGIIGNLLILLTIADVYRRSNSFNVFFGVVGAVGLCDFSFLILTVTRHSIRKADTDSFLIFYCLAEGLGAAFSLASDMLTLGLTGDRFLALSYPSFYKKRSARTSVWASFTLITVLVSATRFHYSIENYYYQNNRIIDTAWFRLIRCFSDVGVPLTIDILLVAFTASVSIDLVTWRRARVLPARCINNQDEYYKTRRHISLLIVLLISYLLNHVGYLAHGLSHIWLGELPLSYFSSPNEIKHYVSVSMTMNSLKLLGDTMESIASSITLYAYITVNKEFYNYFMHALSWLLELFVFCCWKRYRDD